MLPSTEHASPHSAKLFQHMFYFKCVTDQPRTTVYIGLIHTPNALLDWHQTPEEYCEVSIITSLCLSSCCWAFCSNLQTQFLAPSVIPRNSNETNLAKKSMTVAVPSEHELVQSPNGTYYLLFSSRYPSVLLPGYPLKWVLCVLGLHKSRWQTGGV